MTKDCQHLHWQCIPSHPKGDVTCLDCGKDFPMYIALNHLYNSIQEIKRRLNEP